MLADGTEVRDEVFLHCATIASACIRLFRIKELKANTIPITPEGGYEARNGNPSEIATKYLQWYFKKNNYNLQNVQYCESKDGEKKFKIWIDGKEHSAWVDGFIPAAKRKDGDPANRPTKDLVIEVLGCK